MDLERNLIDNILECEIKLGHASLPVSFYYPCRSLLELLQCKEEQLPAAIKIFQQKQQGRLGDVVIEELVSEKGRYVITVPASGVDWVSTNYQPSEFMKLFVAEITNPNNDFRDILKVFQRFSENIEVKIFRMFETLSRYTVIQNILLSPPFCQVSKSNIIIVKKDELY